MNIGFVSTWMERGAAYVTKSYIKSVEKDHNIFVYARGGEKFEKNNPIWDKDYVTWSPRRYATNIDWRHFKKWVISNNIEVILFNEQQEIEVVYNMKKYLPDVKLGSYIDYYKENTLKDFELFDFLICNTKRHYSVFKNHPQCYYVPWGTDINLFSKNKQNTEELVFFHSAGMSNRKGTTYTIDAFIKGEIYKDAKLIIHIQKDFEKVFAYNKDELKKYNIEVIEKTVTAPGLYHLGDIYVYPTKLDGLGLTMYEALSSSMPVITTDNAPMNEVIDNEVGRLVDVEKYISRSDGYYWPLSIVNEDSLINSMKYYIDNFDNLPNLKKKARERAKLCWNWDTRVDEILNIFENSKVIISEPNIDVFKSRKLDRKIINSIGSSKLYGLFDKLISLRK